MKRTISKIVLSVMLIVATIMSTCVFSMAEEDSYGVSEAASTSAFALDVTAALNENDSTVVDVVITIKDIVQALDAVEFELTFNKSLVSGVVTQSGSSMDSFMTVKPMYTFSMSGNEFLVSRYEQICTYHANEGMYKCRFIDLLSYDYAKPGEVYNGLTADGSLVITIPFKIKSGVSSNVNMSFAVTNVKGTTRSGYNSVAGSGESIVFNPSAHNHVWAEATCAAPKTCVTCGVTEGSPSGHTWNGYTCTVCQTKRDYYLFGYINGRDYACETDYMNMGQYKFVNGKLKVTFNEDSYVGVKTTDNSSWYMTQSYVSTNFCVMYNTSTGACEKMFVPGGKEVTFTLMVNGDDTIALTYEVADQLVIPELVLSYPTLSFEDQIQYNIYFTASDLTSVTEMGLLTFSSKLTNGTISNAKEVIPGYITSGSSYVVTSHGVPAKNLGDAVYFKVYAKLTDGSYVYTDIAGYNAVAYAKTVLSSSSTSMDAKRLMVAMLNYGAEAQLNFNYKTDNLMNSFLTAGGRALVADYNEAMVDDIVQPVAYKAAHYAMQDGTYSTIFPSVSFEGAFSINFYFANALAADGGMTFVYWDTDTYNSVSKLTTANATGMYVMTQENGKWHGAVEGIAAKDMDKTIYVAAIYKSGGVQYPTKIIPYSLGKYCENIAAQGNSFGAATAVYGYYAKIYFAS